ncbi:thioesterase family protein [Nocardia sp. BMG51109]|uniref:thioesterase family protein n=1 Tax=Nocardia sp. BMG51109 TaxID=1056816 RepID=UPI000463CE02|nr:thioesterase family protein [Nocardia sp. BMG51109]
MSSSFLRETEVTADTNVPGRATGTLSEDWNAPVYPHGGITAALAVRAMQREFDQSLRSVHTLFVSPIPPGPVTADVTVLRRGRTMSQASATVSTAGGIGLIATAAFGDNRPGFEFTDVAMPEAKPPEHYRSFDETLADGITPAPLWAHVEGRMVRGRIPWEPHEPQPAEQIYWYRFKHPPRDAAGTLDPSALLVLADTMPGAIYERLGPEAPRWLAPSVDMTVRVLTPTRSDWILSRIRAHDSHDGYVSLENELWDPTTATLIAHATQLAFYSFPGTPSGDGHRRHPATGAESQI